MAMAQQISSQTETSAETKDSKRASTSRSLKGSSDQQWEPLSSFIRQSVLNEKDIPPYSQAVLSGNIAVLKKNKKKGKNINFTENAIEKPCCLLHYGTLAKLKDKTKYHNLKKLISLGADLEQRDACDRTPLHFALLMGDMTAVDILFRVGCDVTAKCHGHNVVHLAAMSGNPDVFEMVVSIIAHFDPGDLTDYGFAAIHLAAMYNHDQMVATLVKHGANVNQCSEGILAVPQSIMPVGNNVFQQYILQSLQGVARVVVGARAAAFTTDNVSKFTEVLQGLSTFLNDSDTTFSDEVTLCSLELALFFGCFRAVESLVDHGVDTVQPDSSDQSSLLLAAYTGDVELVKYLFHHYGILRGSSEFLPVILAAASGASDVVEFLVGCCDGSRIMLKAEESDSQSEFSCMSLVDIACFMNRPEVLRFAIKMENNRSIYSSKRRPNNLLLLSIMGRWLMTVVAAAIPLFAPFNTVVASEEEQRIVVSIIVNLPGCNLMEINPFTQTRIMHFAVGLSQAAAVDAILEHLQGIPPSIIDALGPFPLLQISVICFYGLEESWEDEMEKVWLSKGHSISDVIHTIDVLLKHGHDINGIDVDGCTCLDYAAQDQIGEIQSFLLTRGALTSRQVESKQAEAQAMLRLEERVQRAEQRSLDSEKLIQENKGLLHENIILKSKQEELMHRIERLRQGFSSLYSAFMGETVGRSHSKEMPKVDVGDGKIVVLDDSDIQLMAAKWLEIGNRLGIHLSVLDIIKEDHKNSCEQACYEMLCRWCRKDSHTGDQPRTLMSILLALKRCGCEEYTKELEKKHNIV